MESKIIKYITAGDVFISNNEELLVSTPLGTCIAVIAYHKKSKTGGMAHIMLPGKSLEKNVDNNKYAQNGFDSLLRCFLDINIPALELDFCLIGGANVLKKENDTLSKSIIDSTLRIIDEKQLLLKAESLGGIERRVAKLDISTAIVSFTIGENAEQVLWKFNIDNEYFKNN